MKKTVTENVTDAATEVVPDEEEKSTDVEEHNLNGHGEGEEEGYARWR